MRSIFKGKYLILLFLFSSILVSCQDKTASIKCNPEYTIYLTEEDYSNLNEEWKKKSISFTTKLLRLIKNNPKQISKVIFDETRNKIPLKDNYFLLKENSGAGYITLFYEALYKGEELISYELVLDHKDFLLLQKLGFNLDSFFKRDVEGYYYYHYNLGAISSDKNIDRDILFYISPYSGFYYGCRGGYGDMILENRCAFKKIEHRMNKKNLLLLFSSVNPASRLTAVEYFLKNKSNYTYQDQQLFLKNVEKVYKSFKDGEVLMPYSDLLYYSNVKEEVNKLVLNECH